MPSPASVVTNQKGTLTKRGCAVTFLLWLVSIGVFIGCSIASEEESWPVLGPAALIVATVVAPTLALLLFIDLIPYLNWKQERGVRTLFWRLLVWLGSWLTAFVILLIVFAATAVGMDSDWQRPNAAKIAVTLLWIVLALFFLRLSWELLKLPFKRDANSTEAAEDKAFEERQYYLSHPDFPALEAKLGLPVPETYKSLFAEGSDWLNGEWMLYPRGLENDEELHEVMGLEPARAEAVRHDKSRPDSFVCFAYSEFGEYWISSSGVDPAVYHVDLSGQFSDEPFCKICEHLSEFLTWPRDAL